ncbi:MAG: chromosomal replication initiator protein DnaA, partial [Tannerellaceae bacterium]|nr:chromosomal replication initiator protein DnaA [Tannerellaceae bacterium]
GVGKTHLCHAIGTRIRELHPEKRVLYVSSHLFRVQFTDATRKNTVNDFLYFYQNLDVLIMDDIQEIIGLDKTQNTFFHIFNHLHQLRKQLVLTSDKAPVDLQGMEERLVTRLKWGLTAELSRPDLELRKKILRNKADHDGIVISEEVLDYIAKNVTDNIRDLEGILVSLMANSVINNREIDLALAKRVISQAIRLEKKQITIQMIQEIVCKYFNLEQSLIQTPSRKREIVQARQLTMYLSKKYTDSSFSHIGKIIGRKDHATVLHACKTIKDQIEISKSFRIAVEEIEIQIKN